MGWLARLFGWNKESEVGFRGNLGIKVKRANPTRWQRLLDKLKGIA